jgi:hypothetical protein
MTDADFLAAFEDGSLPEERFHHRDHIRAAWLILRAEPLAAALARFTAGLQRFAERHGKAGLYHETITWAYFFLIHERMQRGPAEMDWESFAAANPDLLTWRPSILAAYYREETLRSDLARASFVLPDRLASLPPRSARASGSASAP